MTLNLTIVLATSAGPSFIQRIGLYYELAKNVTELIIVLPSGSHFELSPKADRITVIYAPEPGQVSQRRLGIDAATSDFILQLDDDIDITAETLVELYSSLKDFPGKNTVVGPRIIDVHGRNHTFTPRKTFVTRLFDLFYAYFCRIPLSQSRQGRLSPFGDGFPVYDDSTTDNGYFCCEWLLGGCMLYPKLIYPSGFTYPYAGKAYAEDLMHCILMHQAGFKFVKVLRLEVRHTGDLSSLTGVRHLKEKFKHYRARYYCSRLMGTGTATFLLYLLLEKILIKTISALMMLRGLRAD